VPAGDVGDLDRQLVDPRFDRPDGDTCDPAPCGHSNYFADPAFEASVEKLMELRDLYPSVCGRCPGNHASTSTRSMVAACERREAVLEGREAPA
jgi:hypothetical protein